MTCLSSNPISSGGGDLLQMNTPPHQVPKSLAARLAAMKDKDRAHESLQGVDQLLNFSPAKKVNYLQPPPSLPINIIIMSSTHSEQGSKEHGHTCQLSRFLAFKTSKNRDVPIS